jgi:cyclopropane fatty-acyl-phospholipid synthase-like methyltransferase
LSWQTSLEQLQFMEENKDYYKSRFIFDKDRTVVWRAINEYFAKFVIEADTVLDIGCGYGDFSNGIIAKKKFAIDLNEEMQKYLHSEVEFKAQSVLEPYNHIPANSVDVVFASNLFEHFTDNELNLLLSRVKIVLKNGGKLILMQPNIYYAYREYWDDYTHKKAFSHISLTDFLVANGFTIDHIEKRFIPFSLKTRLHKSYWITKLYLMLPFRLFAKQMLVVAKLK